MLAQAGSAEDFWGALTPQDAGALIAVGIVRRFSRGRALLSEGQVPDRVLLVRGGRVKVSVTTAAGREVVLAFRGPGQLVGEQSAVDGAPRSANVIAVEPVEALVLTAAQFRVFLADRPAAALVLLRILSLRLRDADANRIELSAMTAIERVAGQLLELAHRYGEHDASGSTRIALPLTQEELAGATGASLESVARALHTLRGLGCIATARREIRVLDPDALRALRRGAR